GLMAALGASDNNVIIALIAILVPGATRVVRSQALSIKELDYTLAAKAIGATATRVVLRHILPNVMATYIVLITITLGFTIVVEAALSFLGVGVPPDVPTWGGMMQLGRKYIDITGWLVVFPGIAIALVVFSVNFLGDGLRDVLDPKLRGR
ncbi:MAG: ABC transporter permease, partial [Chloroflexi bacterium]|nr:ABC transporter permease [Chloroflexota bacterium]